MVLPSNEEEGEALARYREKQEMALVVYHLHKWAAEVDCTLAFVREGEEEIKGTDTIGSNKMGMLIRRVAMGLPLVVMERTANDGKGGGKVGRCICREVTTRS
jgi:hypothetical protein